MGISRVGPATKSTLFGDTINSLVTKLVRSRGQDIGLILLLSVFIDLDSNKLEKKKEFGPYQPS